MSNFTDDDRSGSGDLRASAVHDRNATLKRLIVEGLRVEETELPSWRAQVAELYRAASQSRGSG